ncbi:hypothetical protein E8E11_007298 [Didymella keratinophila]|nr:hypothetical protein E8E11_007298 [Didymella keratinophila]
MAGEESRQCPHFDITDGVCGCPEFWRPVQGAQHGWSHSALRETSSARYSQSAPNRQVSSSVNSIPDPDRKKIQQVTPTPPSPPKETCFFWYHGSCRRGDECDRPHEAHTTWPIPPPPGFRHYQPCTLQLCPLRADLTAGDKPQEYWRRRRTIGGQTDGAAFSRATTAGESSSDSDININTDTDTSEIDEDTYVTAHEEILGLPTGGSQSSQGSADKEGAQGATQIGEVKEEGRNGFDESDYVDMSQLLLQSPPSIPLVKEETLLSISHPGTLSKRRHSPATNSPRNNNKRARLNEVGADELDNVMPLFERPRKMSQWDKKPCSLSLDGQHSEPAAPYRVALHNLPAQPTTEPRATNNSVKLYVSPPFDPPRGPRSMSTLSPICFFFYHKGYCNPKRGRKCDYLHDTTTAQQTVSLPPPEIKHELPTSARATSFEVADSFLRNLTTPIRSQPPEQMMGSPLPRLTGPAKEQRTHVEYLQGTGGISAAEAASAFEAMQQRHTEKQKKRKKRAKKKTAFVSGAEELQLRAQSQEVEFKQDVHNRPGTLSMQQPLPSLQPLHSLPLKDIFKITAIPVIGIQKKKKPRQRSKNKLRNQVAESLRSRVLFEEETTPELMQEVLQLSNARMPLQDSPSSLQGAGQSVIGNGSHGSKGRAFQVKGRADQCSQAWQPSTMQHQRVSSYENVPYEYPQDSLGLSSAERRAHIHTEQQRRETWTERQMTGQDDATSKTSRVARDGRAALAASVRSADPRYEHNASYDGSVDRPSCRRCRDTREGCDRTNEAVPCWHYNDTDISAEGCVGWHPDGGSTASRHKSLVDYELPEGDQRLDWDTDLVRRLFGEIE